MTGQEGEAVYLKKAYHGDLAVQLAFVLTSLSTVVVALRFYSRYYLVGKLRSPDWVMLLALICTWGCAVINYYQIYFTDYSQAFTSKEAWARTVTGSLLTWWIYRLFYIVDLCLIKISILLFYNYVASSHKSFHLIVKVLIGIVCASSFGMLIASVFACNPPSDAWSAEVFFNGFLGIYATQCYNPTIIWYFTASWNLFTDCIVWVLPIPFVLNLSTMPLKRRLGLAGVFSLGIMAIVASSVRLYVLVQWNSDWIKQGQNTANLLIWGQVEQHAGIISASIPFLRPLVRKVKQSWCGARRKDGQPPPSPAAKLIHPHLTPDANPIPPRTPIIPSPSATYGSSSSGLFRLPPDPLKPISPIRSGYDVGSAV
ncbi:hypothetical protein B0J11DRAFT_40223 [Dendryphion nanum]|uniref:Rhodopsin domain-containing protein n=1 Tax=Dendryphion nanum TaxID=256645 RepID=A0A9P9J0X9_9PLEO|nr:hypothetical protein B0J11DRAFT_40223 [Dendryphion nanum]